MFRPASIELSEGPEEYEWSMTTDLDWTGTFRGKIGQLQVPATENEPFVTDLASVPRILTWLVPRYGKYTKAAVLHDYYCTYFRQEAVETLPMASEVFKKGIAEEAERRSIELDDRSDADEIFRLAMTELKVPWITRWLMWTAVSWATLVTSLRTGRSSRKGLQWVGRAVLLAGVAAAVVLFFTGRFGALLDLSLGWKWLRVVALAYVLWAGIALVVLAAGYVAQGRWDRGPVYLFALLLTVAALPLLAPLLILLLFLALFLLIEDAWRFPRVRRWIGRLVAKLTGKRPARLPRTPRERRIAAVRES